MAHAAQLRRTATVIVALVLPVLGGCSGASEAPSTTPPAAGSVPTTAAEGTGTDAVAAKPVTDVCSILTVEQVKSVLGATVTATPNKRSRVSELCEYKDAGKVVLQLEYQDSAFFKEPQQAMQVLTAGFSTTEPVTGLGDAAAFLHDDVLTDKLVVAKKAGSGIRSLGVVIRDDKAADTKDKATKLAEQAVGNI
jgi:hypothetical protein